MKRTICIFIILSQFILSLCAQTDPISGRVVDEKGDPVIGAIVTQYSLPDTIQTGNDVTGVDGSFHISSPVSDKKYLLGVTCWGYKKKTVPQIGDSIRLVMQEDFRLMREVVKTGTQRFLKRELGKFVFTPGRLERSLSSSYDILCFTPMVNMQGNTASIVGKGTSTIYINGKKQTVSDEVVMEYLRSLPSGKVEKVEVITSPDASYPSATQGGIINIILKPVDQGLMGNVSGNITYMNKRFTPQLSNYYAFAKRKIKASVSWTWANQNSLDKTRTTYYYKDSGLEWESLSETNSHVNALSTTLNLTCDLTPRSVLGWSGSTYFTGTKTNSAWENVYVPQNAASYGTNSSEHLKSPFRRPQMGTRMYYNLKTDDRGSNLDAAIAFVTSSDSTGRYIHEHSGGSQQNTKLSSYGVDASLKYSYNLKDKSKLDFGYEYNLGNITHALTYLDFTGNQWMHDYTKSNQFNYTEHIHAGFASYVRKWTKVVNTRIGLRLEQTRASGLQESTGAPVNKRYFDFAPQGSLSLNLADGRHNISLDYNRSISRPSFRTLNPFRTWTSETSYQKGNPDLQPSRLNSYNLNYTLLGKYVVGATLYTSRDVIEKYTRLAGQLFTEETYSNIGQKQQIILYASVNNSLFKGRWLINGKIEAYHTRYDTSDDYADIAYSDWTVELLIRNLFLVSRKRNIQVGISYIYHTPTRILTDYSDRHRNLLYASLSKRFKKGGTLGIEVNNPTNFRDKRYYDCKEYRYSSYNKANRISVVASFSQTFGNTQVKGARDNSSSKHLYRLKE